MTLTSRLIDVAGGRARIRVYEGGDGPALLFLHGAGGLMREDPFVSALATRYRVYAPLLPGYEDSTGEERLRTMLDIALHAYDVSDALGLVKPLVCGLSMGGMIAAEMACLAPRDLGKLALVAPAGLWMDEHPIPDIYAMLPYQIAEVLFHDPANGQALLTGGADLSDLEALKEFYIGSQRRLSMAGKILFPIPNRRLSKRLYRLTAPTLLVWGAADRLIIPAYAERWKAMIPGARLVTVEHAGHMLPYEQPEAFVRALGDFLG
jgi:pimeloyl-ACP methyl ester carboxylesterase